MRRKFAELQLDLFEAIERPLPKLPQPPNQLMQLLQMLLTELAATLISGEVGNDKDHR
jgi:hypothetical protein